MKLKTSTLDKIAILLFFTLLTLATLCLGLPTKHVSLHSLETEPAESVTPYELVAFNAKQAGHTSRISWKVLSHRDNFYLVLERSFDGQNFSVVDIKKGSKSADRKGSGYSFSEECPNTSRVYYRLKLQEVQATEMANLEPILSPEDMFAGNPLANAAIDFYPQNQQPLSIN